MYRGCLSTILWACIFGETLAGQGSKTVDFGRDVQPILREHCFGCHGPAQQMQGLRLDRRRVAMPNRVGANGASIVPGDSARSPVYLKLTGKQAGLQMPPTGPLSPGQIGLIKTWIDEGAEWPDELAGETPLATPDPQATRMMQSLRNGEHNLFTALLRRDPTVVNSKGSGGSTPLMYAVLYGDPDSVRLLLERGADPNLRNDGKATALMYAADDPEKTRLLLEHGADANARSDEGRTPLLIAASRSGSSPVVRLLLDHGANPSDRDSGGRTVLNRAGSSGDPELIHLLLDRGADRKPLPLAAAVRVGCSSCADLLMKFAEQRDLNNALTSAVQVGDVQSIKLLLDRGARGADGVLPALVLSPESLPMDVVKTLVDRDANINATTRGGGTVLDLARRQGGTQLVDLLVSAGAKESAKEAPVADLPVAKPKRAGSVRAAIERSIPPLQRADVAFLKKSGCVSCHNNSLTAMAMTTARTGGLSVNEQIARGQLQATAAYLNGNRERALQGLGIPGGLDTVGYILFGLAAGKYPADEVTDVWARYLKNAQSLDGRWRIQASRPPLESSDIQATATVMRALQVYAPKSNRFEYEKAVRLAARWLESAVPKSAEDRVFQLFGLQWAGGSRTVMNKVADELIASQRPDGGWAQLATLASDAYATGQALTALKESGLLAVSSSVYQRGVQFLLNSQFEDGSWYVQTRTLPAQPYFDSDFPHGPDQFISAAATNWAVTALVPAVRTNPK
jgi:ankyrin repeat protein